MKDAFQQDNRSGRLLTSLGKDVLALKTFDGEDHMNGLFEYRVTALAADEKLDLNALIGTHATITIADDTHGDRYFDGIVAQARWSGAEHAGARYELTLRPWFWLCGHRRKQRIYHGMTVVEILQEVLTPYAALGKPHLTLKLSENYPKLEYTVQYRESDLAFATRLMESYGISYHFSHDDGSHTLVLTDWMEAHEPLPGATRLLLPEGSAEKTREQHFWLWSNERNLTAGLSRLTDYNFKNPGSDLETERMGDATYAEGQIENYDYPGFYTDAGLGKRLVGLRTDQERGQDQRQRAVGDCVSLGAGMLVSLSGNATAVSDGETYLCLTATHSYQSEEYVTGEASGERTFSGSYVLMPKTTPLAPQRKTPKPAVQGPQTAVVVGEGEIDCDEYGRILVHFHWDLDKRYSMRCRVSQNWAGKGWGGMVIPRIGMEVVVEFLEGDPDKPLVTGCVYNGRNGTPYPLPADKTKSVFKTDTHKGGGFNELTFEDERDQEKIYMHGQKDHEIDILNDRSKSIGRDQSEVIGRDKTIAVGQDHTESVGRDEKIAIGRDVMYQVGQNQQEKYGKDHVHTVGNIHKQDIFADHLSKIGRNAEHAVLGRYTLDVNEAITNNTKVHTLMAFQKFVIKGPGGKITIDSSGITLEAAKINLKGNVSMGGSGGAQVPTLQGAANAGLPLVEECSAQKEE
jgi:type VI secretion system secreted protein VgrG